MIFTGPAGQLPMAEQVTILRIACELGVPATFLAAIRIAENGGPGREFGVLSEDAPTYEDQARICARSIRNAQYRFVSETRTWPIAGGDTLSDAFIAAMGHRWAPDNAANDPDGLNAFWVKNVTTAYLASGIRP